MNIDTKSYDNSDYLLIETKGSIFNYDEFENLTIQWYNIITSHGKKKIIIDELELRFDFALDYFAMCNIVNYYTEELPCELKTIKIAVVSNILYKEIKEFWENCSNNRGFNFKVFFNMEDAIQFISN